MLVFWAAGMPLVWAEAQVAPNARGSSNRQRVAVLDIAPSVGTTARAGAKSATNRRRNESPSPGAPGACDRFADGGLRYAGDKKRVKRRYGETPINPLLTRLGGGGGGGGNSIKNMSSHSITPHSLNLANVAVQQVLCALPQSTSHLQDLSCSLFPSFNVLYHKVQVICKN